MDDCEHSCECPTCSRRFRSKNATEHLAKGCLDDMLEAEYEKGKEDGKEPVESEE